MIYSSSLSVVLDDEINPFTAILDKVLDFTNSMEYSGHNDKTF